MVEPFGDDRHRPVFGSDTPQEERASLTRALVLVPDLRRSSAARASAPSQTQQNAVHSPDERLVEASELARAIDLEIVGTHVVPVPDPRAGTLFGTGKLDEIAAEVRETEAGLVIVDHAITPIQQRNLETAWDAKVLDRTGLILEIFGRRARTREGRLQVELAHLTYQRGRLVRSWTHLERQRGGFGFLGGPGETQIETDRRIIQERIDKIRSELDVVVRTRQLHRAGRQRVPYPVVALVGYTNAGKSTLFNAMTDATVFAKDQVFATLDPTMREVALASGRKIILSDTVGFISNLPTTLVAAFRATLEEVVNADVILHVRDISHRESEAQKADVDHVLGELGIDPHAADAPILEVFNKIDLVDRERREILENENARRNQPAIMVSALKGVGLEGLRAAIDARLSANDIECSIVIGPAQGRIRNWIYENAEILETQTDEEGNQTFHLRLSPERQGQLEAKLAEAI